jgi:hypothetical protein
MKNIRKKHCTQQSAAYNAFLGIPQSHIPMWFSGWVREGAFGTKAAFPQNPPIVKVSGSGESARGAKPIFKAVSPLSQKIFRFT